MAVTKKTNARQTSAFYALISQLPDYDKSFQEEIRNGVIDSYLTEVYGKDHGKPVSLSLLSDEDYQGLLANLKREVNKCKSIERLQREATRKKMISQILRAFTRIGVTAVNGNYEAVNYHILRLPISKGRIIPQFHDDELVNLLGAVRAYCDNILKQQKKEQSQASKN